jgi:Na+-driven multidrug efflux pump
VLEPATASARFVTGSTLRHVVVMAGTGAVGMIAVFAVDLLSLFYISILGQRPIAAAVGFAGVVGFFQTSIAIGMTIGVGAVVSRFIGAGRLEDARRIATSSLIVMLSVTAAIGVATAAGAGPIVDLLGAVDETRRLAVQFIGITSPTLPLLAAGMCCSALLRSVGDARRAMNVTLFAAFATAGIDPVLIFGLHLGLTGAAITVVMSRLMLSGLGWLSVVRRHHLLAPVTLAAVAEHARLVGGVAGPAILTNLATPVGAAYVTQAMARFGPDAVAGQATIDRITPVAFGMVYALSGSVGPIVAQNLGALQFARVREALLDSLLCVVVAVGTAWLVLALLQGLVVAAFSAVGVTADLIRLFCSWLAASFLFVGALFVANAAFNNLGFPLLSTLFNWGRATLGTIPFVTVGVHYGPAGVLTGQALGSVIFGLAAVLVAFRVTGRLGDEGARGPAGIGIVIPAGSGQAALASLVGRLHHH